MKRQYYCNQELERLPVGSRIYTLNTEDPYACWDEAMKKENGVWYTFGVPLNKEHLENKKLIIMSKGIPLGICPSCDKQCD